MSVITVYGNSGGSPISANYTQPSGGSVFPPGVTPGDGNGDDGTGTGGGPGGIGGGDGGITTPSDTTITTPSITFPNAADNTNITEFDTATSSVFAATGGRTHAASRWIIGYWGETVDPSSPTSSQVIVYDSGVDVTNLTSLPLDVIEMAHAMAFQIAVRYKADGTDTWSAWSAYQDFYTETCPPDISGLVLWYDASDINSFTESGGLITQWADKSNSENHAVQADPALQFARKTDKFALGAVEYDAAKGMAFTELSVTTSTIVMVIDWTAALTKTGIGISKTGSSSSDNIMVRSTTPGPVNGIAIATNDSTSYTSTNNVFTIIESGQYIVEFVLSTPAASTIWINGVDKTAITNGSGWLLEVAKLGLDSTYVGNGNQLAELLIYDNVVSSSQRAALRESLANKWGITL